MMFFSKMFLSVLLVLGLVACPGDDDEKKEDYTLKIGSVSDVAVGGEFSVPVEIHKGSEIVKEGDGAKLKVTVAVSCKAKESTDKDARTDVKPDGKAASAGKVTITGTAHSTWKADDTCTAKATAEGAKEATKDFKITAASGEGEDETDTTAKTPKFNVASPKFGQEFVITDGVGKSIALGGSDGTGSCATAFLYRVSGETTKAVEKLTSSHDIEEHDAFFVIGEGDCKVTVAGIDDPQGFTAMGDNGTPITVEFESNNIKVTFVAEGDDANRQTPLLFVKGNAGSWVQVSNLTWEDGTTEFPSTVARHATDESNEALLRASGYWTHDAGGS